MLGRRIANASVKGRAYITLAISALGIAGAWLGYTAGADASLGGVILLGFILVLVMLSCLAGAAVFIPKHTRAFYGTIGFEIAAVFSIGALLGMTVGRLAR
jgi:hypothetical protein